jgi:hypothetical protein
VKVDITFVCVKITIIVKITMRVKITLERVVITLLSVIYTRLRVKITLVCVESRRLKSHAACVNRNLRVEINLMRVEITLVRIEITLCLWKFHSACRNQTLACPNHFR